MRNTKIDKIKISNIPVIDIENPEELRKKSILIKDKKNQNYTTESGKTFTRLCIKDKVVDQYSVGINNLNHNPYNKLELSIHGDHGNLYCNTVTDTYMQIIRAQGHLLENYGILTENSDAKISYIEINRTFPIEGKFEEYKRVLFLMMSRLPKNKGTQIDFKNLQDSKYVIDEYASNNTMSSIKIYNKSSQLKLKLGKDVMRVELTLKKAKSVKSAFGTNRLEDLTDEMIDQYFVEHMQKYFRDSILRWKVKRDKKLIKLMREMKESQHHWIGSVLGALLNEEILTGIPAVLDINEILPLVDQVVTSRRKARTKEQFQTQAKRIYTAFDRRDDEKLEELLRLLCTTSEQLPECN